MALPSWATIIGTFDVVNLGGDNAVHGWTCETTNPNASQTVLMYRAGRYIGSVASGNEYRPDVPAAGLCGGNNYTGWRYTVPLEERDGVNSTWTAAVYVGPGNEPALANAPTGSFAVVNQVDYITPQCIQWTQTSGYFATYFGQILDTPSIAWNFATKVGGVPPLTPITTYDAAPHTGTSGGPSSGYWPHFQRGDNRTSGSVSADTSTGRSMLQLNCTSAGIMTNAFWLDTTATEKGGQWGTTWSIKSGDPKLYLKPGSVNTVNTYQPGRYNTTAKVQRPFATGGSLIVDGDVVVPAMYYIGYPNYPASYPAQVDYYLYFWDPVSGDFVALVQGLWDSRPTSNGPPIISHDGFTAFGGQTAANTKYATVEYGSWTPGTLITTDRRFRIRMSAAQLQQLAIDVNNAPGSTANLSLDVRNYILTSITFGSELAAMDMSLGTSVRNFTAFMTR